MGERVFFFLRDPVSRFVSAFNSRQRQGQPRYHSPWNPLEKIAFGHFSTPNDLASALSSTDMDIQTQAQIAMQSIRHVRQSLWSWFGNQEYLGSRAGDIPLIGFQETLADDFERLKSTLSLPREMRLPDDDFNAFKSPAGLDNELCERAVDNLRRWYRNDYGLIAQCRKIRDSLG